jgi:hypothetical protein
MTTLTLDLLDVSDAKAALTAVDAAAPGVRRRLSASLRDALRGWPAAVRRYVAAYDELLSRLLAALHEQHPDVVLRDEVGEYRVAYPAGPAQAPVELLRSFAADAPFSPWVAAKGPGAGVALDLLARLRSLLPGAEPLPLPRAAALPRLEDPDALLRFVRLVGEAQRAERSDLERIREVFGVSITELGGLFGVTRQAAGLWLAEGPPAARRAKAATVAAIADILTHRLKPARVPGIVRRSAAEYDGRTMLELVAADRHDWLLESVRRSFDYATTA